MHGDEPMRCPFCGHEANQVKDSRPTEDGAATLTALTTACVAEAARHFPEPATRWLVHGGGRRNRTVMAMLGAAVMVLVAMRPRTAIAERA